MNQRPFFERLAASQKKHKSLLCVGLDPEPSKLPDIFKKRNGTEIARFNRAIIEATSDMVCAYKPNWAFYEALGIEGLRALEKTIEAIPGGVAVIADAKRGDIGNTAACYARSIFETWKVDAVTVSPYLGLDSLEPFLSYGDRGVYVLCLTSNPGTADFQIPGKLYLKVARTLAQNDKHRNVGLVVGATQAKRIAEVRQAAPELPFLLPGVGSQGGDAQQAVHSAWSSRGGSVLVNVSRSVLYASKERDFAEAARRAAESLRQTLQDSIPRSL